MGGYRTADPESPDETYFILRQRQGMAWIGLYRPDMEELRSGAEEFDPCPAAQRTDHGLPRPAAECARRQAALVTQRQNDEMISSWAAIVFAPSLVGTI